MTAILSHSTAVAMCWDTYILLCLTAMSRSPCKENWMMIRRSEKTEEHFILITNSFCQSVPQLQKARDFQLSLLPFAQLTNSVMVVFIFNVLRQFSM